MFRELTKQESAIVLPPRSPQLLARHPKLLDVRSRQQVRELLDRYEALRTVIEFRDRLQQIWDGTAASHARALQDLRELCAQAESSSILALRNFALRRVLTHRRGDQS